MPSARTDALSYHALAGRALIPVADYRHDDHGWAHFDDRRSDDDFRTTVIITAAPSSAPSSFGDKTAGGGDKGDNAADEQDHFHIVSGRW